MAHLYGSMDEGHQRKTFDGRIMPVHTTALQHSVELKQKMDTCVWYFHRGRKYFCLNSADEVAHGDCYIIRKNQGEHKDSQA